MSEGLDIFSNIDYNVVMLGNLKKPGIEERGGHRGSRSLIGGKDHFCKEGGMREWYKLITALVPKGKRDAYPFLLHFYFTFSAEFQIKLSRLRNESAIFWFLIITPDIVPLRLAMATISS